MKVIINIKNHNKRRLISKINNQRRAGMLLNVFGIFEMLTRENVGVQLSERMFLTTLRLMDYSPYYFSFIHIEACPVKVERRFQYKTIHQTM